MSHQTTKLTKTYSVSYKPVWKDLRTKWTSDLRSQTLQRSESMVSLCYRSLVQFVNDDNLQGLQAFLDNKQVQIDDKDENGTTALMVAATKGRTTIVRELLSHGAEPNIEDNDGWTALLCCAKEGHTDVCLELLEHNAEVEHRDMGNWTALMWATYKGHNDIVTILLERGAEVNAHGNYHISSLLWAAGRGYVQIVQQLINHGAKVNVGDKYGTTALVWACRKGYTDIVELLLKAGANVDTAGMYSWTPLLVATYGNHVDVVNVLLEHKPNVNALDKDGCSSLTIACKEGYYDIATALIQAGTYINIQDRSGDTNLIHAVKGGHRGCVEALLKKYADVDITGKDRKTAIYMAVEKQNINIVKLLLNCNPDLEIATKDGDTPLLKAVRSRNCEIVQLLLDKKAKVSAADKKGDTALHIAMRARSKAIVEILLRNPKNSQLLYRPNRAGETPYNIDVNHQKTILGQIFGARRLNTNEDNENMLGYDLYSSALADILSEPSLSMPITVGLYAKWGSGKSFLLNKLRDEMKNFAREWVDPVFQFTSLLFLIILHVSVIGGVIFGLSFDSWLIGTIIACFILIICYVLLALVWYANKRYDWDWPYNFNVTLTRKMNNIKLILQILFCHPPGAPSQEISAYPIRFYFTDQTRVSSTTGGENSIVQMIGSLYDAIENEYGALSTRLYRTFKPKSKKSSSTWTWRKLCCLPYVLLFEITFSCVVIGICALTVYLKNVNSNGNQINDVTNFSLQIILIIVALLLGITTVANLYTWSKLFRTIFFSQRRHLQRSISKLETLKSEGFLQTLRQEVNLMKEMVKCLDSLSLQQTRMVIIVDGLDSCEQDKVLLILDTVHMLFSDINTPFIVILAIDPHVIAKAVEMNTRRLFSENNIGGHNYLSNMVHLPFYLQNSGLRKVKIAQQTASAQRKTTSTTGWSENEENLTGFLARSSSSRRLSNDLMSSRENLKITAGPSNASGGGRKGSRKLKLSESIASSIGSNLNRIGGAQDLTKMLLTDDYFSDVNPRSMRRLMNVVYVTGRLLKAFQIDFNWYRLASWVNITEQWPFRTSWIIYHYDLYEDQLDDNTPLKYIYDKIRPLIPSVKDTEPLLELDRDEKKFEIFLTFHRSSLLVSDLKIFLPFTINLDPYLKKVIKEESQTLEDDGLVMNHHRPQGQIPWLQARLRSKLSNNQTHMLYPTQTQQNWTSNPQWPEQILPLAPVSTFEPEILETRLSSLNVDGVCKLFTKIEDLQASSINNYIKVIKENNINGRVLLHCDLEELKKILKMSFGDWEMFKVLIISLREHEITNVLHYNEISNNKQTRKTSFSKTSSSNSDKDDRKISSLDGQRKQNVMEKQVTLEEQMICGALQTLNEEACEDVLEETEETKITIEPDNNIPQTSIIPPSPDSNQDFIKTGYRSRTNSACGLIETDFVLLQSSPIGPNNTHWQPISISIGGNSESLSDHSSRCSSQPPSPLLDRRPSIETKKVRHVILKTDPNNEMKVQQVRHTASQTTKPRPKSLHLLKTERSKSIDENNKKEKRKDNKLSRLKEKLLHSSPELTENLSDNESTPLVSELSTSSKSVHSNDLRTSTSNSMPLSPLSQKSPDLQQIITTRSEQNLLESGNNVVLSPFRNRTMSDCTYYSIENANNYCSHKNNSQGALFRQNALDSDENLLTDVYANPK